MRINLVTCGILLVVGTVLTAVASLIFGQPWLMPILGSLVIYPLFLLKVKRCEYRAALFWVLWWAFWQSLVVIVATIFAPTMAAKVIINGTVYTEEIFNWIRTGEGAEGSISLFLGIHLKQYLAFSILSFFTLGSASLFLGTYLLNYMNFYVSQLIQASLYPGLAALIGWPPWSILRVIGFICTGIALTDLGLRLIAKLRKHSYSDVFSWRYLYLGISFVTVDIIVKTILAPIWRHFLLYVLTNIT
jgi:hypothetical protein